MDIVEQVTSILDNWLLGLENQEYISRKIDSIKQKLNRAVKAIEYEGQYTIIEMGRLQYIADKWEGLLEHINRPIELTDKSEIINTLLELFEADQIPKLILVDLLFTLTDNI